jgi:hypothetical protein
MNNQVHTEQTHMSTSNLATLALQAQKCEAICATETPAIAAVGVALQRAANGFAVAIQNADADLGMLHDADISLDIIAQHQASLQTLGACSNACFCFSFARAQSLSGATTAYLV